MCPVPVSGHCLVVPDGGRFCVAQIARLARVVRRVDEQGLCGEGFQVPGFVKLLVLRSATRGAQAHEGVQLGEGGTGKDPEATRVQSPLCKVVSIVEDLRLQTRVSLRLSEDLYKQISKKARPNLLQVGRRV